MGRIPPLYAAARSRFHQRNSDVDRMCGSIAGKPDQRAGGRSGYRQGTGCVSLAERASGPFYEYAFCDRGLAARSCGRCGVAHSRRSSYREQRGRIEPLGSLDRSPRGQCAFQPIVRPTMDLGAVTLANSSIEQRRSRSLVQQRCRRYLHGIRRTDSSSHSERKTKLWPMGRFN